MRVELIYGVDGTINGHRAEYSDGCNMKPIEENEYILEDDEDLKVLTQYLIDHPRAKTIDKKKCKLKICVPLNQLKEKIHKNQMPNMDELRALQTFKHAVNRNLNLDIKSNGQVIINPNTNAA